MSGRAPLALLQVRNDLNLICLLVLRFGCVQARGGNFTVLSLFIDHQHADLGTKAGLQGETLISTGLADFDNLIGGGIPLGSLVLILEDAWTPHGSTLLRYFVAEGAACGHTTHWAAASRPLPSALPQIAKPRSRSSRKVRHFEEQINPHTHSYSACNTPNTVLHAQDNEKEASEQESPQLRIAWQYRRYIQRQQVQQHSGLSSLQEDVAISGVPSLQSGNLGLLTSAPARGKVLGSSEQCVLNVSHTQGKLKNAVSCAWYLEPADGQHLGQVAP